MDSIFAYLEQFRFKPKNKDMYPGYITPVEEEINMLYWKVEPSIRDYEEIEKIRVKVKFLEV
jgi:hypothetical protein